MPDGKDKRQANDLEERLRWLRATYASELANNGSKETEEEKSLPRKKDVKVDAEARTRENELIRKEKLHNNELEQRIKNQQKFFRFALIIIGFPVVIASLGFGVLVFRGGAGDVVYAAFFASVVAEVIGLSYILGNYFFPKQKNDREHDPDKT